MTPSPTVQIRPALPPRSSPRQPHATRGSVRQVNKGYMRSGSAASPHPGGFFAGSLRPSSRRRRRSKPCLHFPLDPRIAAVASRPSPPDCISHASACRVREHRHLNALSQESTRKRETYGLEKYQRNFVPTMPEDFFPLSLVYEMHNFSLKHGR